MDSDDSSMEENFEIGEESLNSFYMEKSNLMLSMLEGKKILEVGCGTGPLIQFLKSKNIELSGTDYSNVYLDKARKKYSTVHFFKADLLDLKAWSHLKNNYDTVIAAEVLEHIEDPIKALKTIYYILKPDGILIMTVPAFNFLFSEHDKKIGHYRRYTKKLAKEHVIKAGFKIDTCRHWNLLGFFGWLLNFKILKKDLKSATKFSTDTILGKWLKIESKITMPFGLTIIIKARK